MGMKRYLCLLFACIAIFSCIPAQAAAADIGEQAAEIAEPRATGEFDFEISAKSMRKASTSFPMEYGETVTISTPEQAVNMCCKEAVGYAAQAFSAKYITGSKPNLSLPVSGPVW